MTGHFEVREPPVVALIGDLDLRNVDGLREVLEATAQAHGQVIVDLSEADFLDSTAIAALLLAHGQGHRVSLRNLHGAPRRVLDVCGALDLLEIEN